MGIKMTITVEGDNMESLARDLKILGEKIDGTGGAAECASPTLSVVTDKEAAKETTAKKSPGRPKKEEPKADAEDDNFDFGGEDNKDPTPTMEDVIGAFKAYAAKHGREKAGKILKKLGVTSLRDLDEDKYEAAMKAVAL